MPIAGYSVVKTFCTTRRADRERVGEAITAWLAAHEQLEVVAWEVLQSSDMAYHALTIMLFLRPKTVA